MAVEDVRSCSYRRMGAPRTNATDCPRHSLHGRIRCAYQAGNFSRTSGIHQLEALAGLGRARAGGWEGGVQ
jgi:hypothetical protein